MMYRKNILLSVLMSVITLQIQDLVFFSTFWEFHTGKVNIQIVLYIFLLMAYTTFWFCFLNSYVYSTNLFDISKILAISTGVFTFSFTSLLFSNSSIFTKCILICVCTISIIVCICTNHAIEHKRVIDELEKKL